MTKLFSDCTETEKKWLREYTSWARSDAPLSLRLAMVKQFYKLLKAHNVEHLAIGRNCDRCGVDKQDHPTQMCFGETPN